ncbi:hypothetical protein [Chitinolyticbacter albus]|uniref:hypothetical protein n=1 Tax=Chitinolyticbacter albus TaxID=2961951 RepID=UPI002109A64B|nr:hypothetical protein [Chitinolyticbacter albus]
MRIFIYLIPALWACYCGQAAADVLPPQAASAAERLRNNPKAFDRYDNFCAGKKSGDACVIPGTAFAGGGNGRCDNDINRKTYTIDLHCVREGYVTIERQLPEGGFVHDEQLCRSKAAHESEEPAPKWNCTPLTPTPSDAFCKGKSINSACTVELTYKGALQRDEGVCKEIVETERFYYQGRREATRKVIQCMPKEEFTRSFTPASWWQKLLQ